MNRLIAAYILKKDMIYFAIILTTLIKMLSVSNILINPFLYIYLSVFEADDKQFALLYGFVVCAN